VNATRKDWLKWVAAGFALVATASAEYEIARAIGMNEWVAIAVPGALDAYVIRALRAHREVLTAVIAMVLVNAASHLVTAQILPLDWRLITAVSAIAPLVLWRVHALRTPAEVRTDTLWGVSEHDGNEIRERAPGLCALGHTVPCVCSERPSTDAVSASVLEPEEPASATFDAHVSTAPGVSDYVPAAWSSPPPFEPTVFELAGYGEDAPEHEEIATVLTLPVGFERELLRWHDDRDVLAYKMACEHKSEHGETLSLNGVKRVCSVGTDRARRVVAQMKDDEKNQGTS